MKLIKGLLISGFALVGASSAYAGGISSQLVYDCKASSVSNLYTDSAATTHLVLGAGDSLVKEKQVVLDSSSGNYVESDVCNLHSGSTVSQLYASDSKTYEWNSGFSNSAATYSSATCADGSTYELNATTGQMAVIASCAAPHGPAFARSTDIQADVVASVAQVIEARLQVGQFCKIDGILDRAPGVATPDNQLTLLADSTANAASLPAVIPGQPGSYYFGQAKVSYSCTFAPHLSLRAIDKDLCVKSGSHTAGTADCLVANNKGSLFLAAPGNGDVAGAPVAVSPMPTFNEGVAASYAKIDPATTAGAEAIKTNPSVVLGEKREADVAIAAKVGIPASGQQLLDSSNVEYEGIFQVVLSAGAL